MRRYEVNFKRFALLILPTFLRQPVIAAVAYSVVSPLGNIHIRFTQFRDNTSYRLTHTGQVCYLRAVLNDTFDPRYRRIMITENVVQTYNTTVYQRELDLEKLVPLRESGRQMVINRRGFGGVNGYDFWVNIPSDIRAKVDLSRLKAVVNSYKLASKRYAINYI